MLDRKALDAAGDNTPYHQRLPISGDDGWVGRIAREQLDAPRALVQFLDRKLAIENGDNDVAMTWLDRPVDHDDVPIVNTFFDHGVARDTEHERGLRMGDQQVIEIQRLAHMVFGRRRKAGDDRRPGSLRSGSGAGAGSGRATGPVSRA